MIRFPMFLLWVAFVLPGGMTSLQAQTETPSPVTGIPAPMTPSVVEKGAPSPDAVETPAFPSPSPVVSVPSPLPEVAPVPTVAPEPVAPVTPEISEGVVAPAPSVPPEDDRWAARVVRRFQAYPPIVQLEWALVFTAGMPLILFLVLKWRKRIGGWLLPFAIYAGVVAIYFYFANTIQNEDNKSFIDLLKDKVLVQSVIVTALRRLLLTWQIIVLPSAILIALFCNRILGALGFAKKRPNRLKAGAYALEAPAWVAKLKTEGLKVRIVRDNEPPMRFEEYEYDYPFIRFHHVTCDLRDMIRIDIPGVVYELKTGTVLEFGQNP